MNGGLAFAEAYLSEFSSLVAKLPANPALSIVLAPPALLLGAMSQQLATSGGVASQRISLSAQNVAAYESGAYTGELSAVMLSEVGCTWSLIGHSERRSLFAERDADVVAKVERVLAAGLRPVVCVGETLAQREEGRAEQVVSEQVGAVLGAFDEERLNMLVLAYEPVWAIGTGRTASPQQAQQMHAVIRALLQEKSADLAERVPVLYGGSVNAGNAKELFAQPDIDGGLVGGASLKPAEFAQICEQMG